MRIEYFQLIDAIEDFDRAGQHIKVRAVVPSESTIFEGHFPGYPLMPGVLLTEAMAQTSGYLILGLQRFERMPFLAGVKDAKFRTFVLPGEVLSIEASLVHEGSGFAVTKAKIAIDGAARCDAQLMFRTAPFPTPEFREMMLAQASRMGLVLDDA